MGSEKWKIISSEALLCDCDDLLSVRDAADVPGFSGGAAPLPGSPFCDAAGVLFPAGVSLPSLPSLQAVKANAIISARSKKNSFFIVKTFPFNIKRDGHKPAPAMLRYYAFLLFLLSIVPAAASPAKQINRSAAFMPVPVGGLGLTGAAAFTVSVKVSVASGSTPLAAFTVIT